MRYNTVDTCFDRVNKYFSSNNFSQPFFVNTENKDEYVRIKSKLSVGVKVLLVSSYCRFLDSNPKIDKLIDDIYNSQEKILLIGLSSYLKLQGELAFRRQFESLCSASIKEKLVVLCYQSQQILLGLCESDLRNERRFSFLQGPTSRKPEITMISNKLKFSAALLPVVGMRALLQKFENGCNEEVSALTNKTKADYSNSIIVIHEINNTYEAVLMYNRNISSVISKSCGTDEQWMFLLEKLSENLSLDAIFKKELSSYSNLELLFQKWNSFSVEQRWLYFIALKLHGTENNCCINQALEKATNMDVFVKELFRGILNFEPTNSKFNKLYDERKELLKVLKDSIDYVVDFCQFAEIKGANIIYYLTDNTQIERFKIVECLSKYEYSDKEILSILKIVYPDLANYLIPFRFHIPLLDDYFQSYKYQKLTNAIRADFFKLVNEHAANREFNIDLPYRSEKFENIEKSNSYLYFVDALGVEFLGYIMTKCRQYGLNAKVTLCHSMLPSITSINKEFLVDYDPTRVVTIKKLDEIKHHGEEDFDYQKTHYPIHVTRELEIIDDVLNRAKVKLSSGYCQRAIIISDHGASRLAVINENVYDFDVDSKGTHGGRCCAFTNEIQKIKYATEENGYYVLASYDRFKGGRAASVETHGGATLEEVVVPIIELTQRPADIEVRFVNDVITVSFRKKAEIILFTKTKLSSVTLCIKDKFYVGEKMDDNRYKIQMNDITRAGEYHADVYEGNNLLVEGLSFHIEKEGSKEKDLL